MSVLQRAILIYANVVMTVIVLRGTIVLAIVDTVLLWMMEATMETGTKDPHVKTHVARTPVSLQMHVQLPSVLILTMMGVWIAASAMSRVATMSVKKAAQATGFAADQIRVPTVMTRLGGLPHPNAVKPIVQAMARVVDRRIRSVISVTSTPMIRDVKIAMAHVLAV